MTSVADDRRTMKRYAVHLDEDLRAIIQQAADAGFDGNMSEAIRACIRVHAGELIEFASEARDRDEYEVGRWTKQNLSRDLVEEVARRVYRGHRVDAAFDALGVTAQQRGSWLGQGKRDRTAGKSTLYADLVAAIAKAEADREADDIEQLRRHGRRSWKATMDLLERQKPDQYGARKRVDASVTHHMQPMIDYDRLDMNEQRELVRLLRKAAPDPSALPRGAAAAADLVPAEMSEVIEGEARLIEAPALEAAATSAAADPTPGATPS